MLSILLIAALALPIIERGACPFEGCILGRMITDAPIVAYQAEGRTDRIAFRLRAKEQFTGIRSDVYTYKPGEAVVTRAFRSFKPGDRLQLISYQGEGEYGFLENGKSTGGTISLIGNEKNAFYFDGPEPNGKLISMPKFTWWILIRNSRGQEGWLAVENVSERGFSGSVPVQSMDSHYYAPSP